MNPSQFSDIKYQLDSDGVVTLEFYSPERKNSITALTALELVWAARHFQSDQSALAMIVTGAALPDRPSNKQIFCSGGYFVPGVLDDLPNEIMAQIDVSDIALKNVVMEFNKVDKPVLAAVNGAAIGGGMTLALAIADQIFYSEFGWGYFPFAKLGLCSELGSTYLLPKLLGYHKAKELLFYPERLPAKTLVDFGIGNTVVAHDDLMDFTREQALKLIPPNGCISSIREMKRIMNELRAEDISKTLDLENTALNELSRHSNFAEALKAQAERRAPIFEK